MDVGGRKRMERVFERRNYGWDVSHGCKKAVSLE
jgi:hypothetical protein